MRHLLRSIRKRFIYLTNPATLVVDGVRVVSKKDRIPETVRDLLIRGHYEDTERNLLRQVARHGMRTLEVGTGIGFVSILATKICGEGNVLSYEANISLEPMIRENYALNGLQPNLVMRAVTRDGAPIRFYQNDNIISSSVIDRKSAAREVVVESDAFGELIRSFNPDVLVMDVEGAEVDLFEDTDLGNIRHIVVELHPHIVGEEKIAAVVEKLKRSGYVCRQQDRKTSHFERVSGE